MSRDSYVIPYDRNGTIDLRNKTYLTITKGGVLKLGPDVTWDEAAAFLLDAVEREIGRRVTSVERPEAPVLASEVPK
jgi:hypothetical protein